MSDTLKLQCGNGYNHWNTLDLVLDINYISFSNPNINSNTTQLPKYVTLITNHQLSQRI